MKFSVMQHTSALSQRSATGPYPHIYVKTFQVASHAGTELTGSNGNTSNLYSNLCQGTDYHNSGVSLQENEGIVPWSRPQPLPFQSFQLHRLWSSSHI